MGDGQACRQSSTAGRMAITTFLGGTRFVARSPLSLTNDPTLLKIALVLFFMPGSGLRVHDDFCYWSCPKEWVKVAD